MVGLVEIEIETVNIVFAMLEADIGVFGMASAKGWANGESHYRKRIKDVMEQLKKLDGLLQMAISNVVDEVNEMKNERNNLENLLAKSNADPHEVVSMKSDMMHAKILINKKLRALKGYLFEKSLRGVGYDEFEEKYRPEVHHRVDENNKTIRRYEDGVDISDRLEN